MSDDDNASPLQLVRVCIEQQHHDGSIWFNLLFYIYISYDVTTSGHRASVGHGYLVVLQKLHQKTDFIKNECSKDKLWIRLLSGVSDKCELQAPEWNTSLVVVFVLPGRLALLFLFKVLGIVSVVVVGVRQLGVWHTEVIAEHIQWNTFLSDYCWRKKYERSFIWASKMQLKLFLWTIPPKPQPT